MISYRKVARAANKFGCAVNIALFTRFQRAVLKSDIDGGASELCKSGKQSVPRRPVKYAIK